MQKQKQPSYLLATSRSGTNLLRSIIDVHPEVSAPPPFENAFPQQFPQLEGDRQRKFIRDVLIWQNYSVHGLFADIEPADVHARMERWGYYELQRAIYEAYADDQDTTHWISKYNGKNFEILDGGLEYYDDLKIIYLVRDARDVALSFKDAIPGPFHPYLGAQLWNREQSIGTRLLQDSDVDVHLVEYEDLLQQPNREIREICEFLDLDPVDEMLAYHDREETKQMAQVHHFENISKPIMSDNYGKFHDQLSDEEVGIVEKVAGDTLKSFGYELVNSEKDLENRTLADESVYNRKNDALSKEFNGKMWRNDPREMIGIRLDQRFSFFLRLRYVGL
jgi:hypothetical protein